MTARDALYTSYGAQGEDPTNRPFLRKLLKHFPAAKDAAIFDAGCGSGALLKVARVAGYTNLRGVDLAPHQVAQAQAALLDVAQGDATKALHSMSGLDLIVGLDVVEHMTRDEAVSFAQAAYRALNPGGRLMVHTPNAESPFFGRVRYGDITHETAFTRGSMRQLLSAAGFEQMEFHADSPAPHGVVSSVRWLCWQVIAHLYRFAIAAETGVTDSIVSQNFLTIAIKSRP